jgi:hypothetical protein
MSAIAFAPAFVVDRPAGFEHVFATPTGKRTFVYPVNYGHIADLVNPEDGDEVDVFLGTGGCCWGRFQKGKIVDGVWSPDEHKWFAHCSIAELYAILKFWNLQSLDLIRDLMTMTADVDDHLGLIAEDACAYVGALLR